VAEEIDPFSPVDTPPAAARDLGFIEAPGGIIVPINRTRVSAKEVFTAIQDALATDYDGLNPRMSGLSKNEAAMMSLANKAQDGDIESIKYLHDRMMGKPVQSTFNLNATADLKDFLSELSQKDAPISDEDVFDV
jgi:hypothetical protein